MMAGSRRGKVSELQPARAIRDTALRAVILVDAQIDHTTGLLMLREGAPLEVYCTDMVRDDLTSGITMRAAALCQPPLTPCVMT